MKNRRAIGIGIGVIVVAAIAWMAFGSKTSDEDQIKNALLSALKASKEGRPGGVIEFLASDVVVNGAHFNVNRQFTGYIRKYHPDISVTSVRPVITGDTATVTSDIRFTVLSRTMDLPNVTFTFKKLNDTKWLIFPSHDWKVTGATAPSAGYQQLIEQLSIDGSFASEGGLW